MKLILITLVAVVVGMMVACGGGSDEYEYPKEIAENYVEGCVFNAEAAGLSGKDAKKHCDCTLKALERDNTLSTKFRPKALEIMKACASTLE